MKNTIYFIMFCFVLNLSAQSSTEIKNALEFINQNAFTRNSERIFFETNEFIKIRYGTEMIHVTQSISEDIYTQENKYTYMISILKIKDIGWIELYEDENSIFLNLKQNKKVKDYVFSTETDFDLEYVANNYVSLIKSGNYDEYGGLRNTAEFIIIATWNENMMQQIKSKIELIMQVN